MTNQVPLTIAQCFAEVEGVAPTQDQNADFH